MTKLVATGVTFPDNTTQTTAVTGVTKSFTSSNQAIPTAINQYFTVAHGLGVTPKFVRVVAVCLTANNGWAVDDEVELMFNAIDNGNQQMRAYANATNVGYYSGSSMPIMNFTNQYTLNIINNTNWAVKVYALA